MSDRVTANGDIELAWDQFGSASGVPLLLVNGLGSPRVAYELGFVDLLVSAGFSVVRFDNRDVGHSSRCTDSYGLADMAADAAAVLDAAGWEKAHVLGQSMGGMIAQQVAIDFGHRTASLTSLMSTTGSRDFGRPTPEALTGILTSAPSDVDGWLANRLATESIWCSPAYWDPGWVLEKGRLLFDHGVDPAGSARQYRAILEGGSRDDALRGLAVPTLVIHGSEDTLVTPSGGRHTADLIPDAKYVEVEGMGHDLPPVLWPRLVDELASFVDSLG